VPNIVVFQFGRRDIIASSPDLHLFLAVFLHSFKFVEALQCSVVSLVESPVLKHRNVMAIQFLGSVVEGLDGSGQH
jgi:hypothetical protein